MFSEKQQVVQMLEKRNELIDALKELSEDVDVQIISNIPSRMQNYYNTPAGDAYREKYRSSYSV